ncbi:MAG TPA: FAD-binding protein [Gammaproteobacteria bacterium]|nr:FAD-binding protein [Gammaproteobacteria bacterium]
MEKFELVVIGSGSAGEKAALQASYYGHSVCVIDQGPAGGAWVNTGTIPSKTLRESALYLARGRRGGVLGDPSAMPTVRSFMALRRHLVARWRGKIEQNFRSHGITRMRGTARFVTEHQLDIGNGRCIEGKYILIATGSRPRDVPELPVDGQWVHDSETLLNLEQIPQSMVVLGGGVIACEYASIFQSLGVQVTLLNGRDRLLGFIDSEVTSFLEAAMVDSGMVVRHDVRAEGLERVDQGEVEVYLNDGTVASGETVFVALGRVPVVDDLNLEVAGVKLTDWNTIKVDTHMVTSVPHIYAAGDVVGFPSLASAGMEQGRRAAAHMFGHDRGAIDDLIPSGVFTIPELSSVGLDEAAAKKAGYEPVTGSAHYRENVRAPMLGDEHGVVKLVADRNSGKLLGATIVGNQATELIHFALAVIKYGGSVDDLTRFVFNLPSLSALYRQAAYTVLHKINQDA